MGIREFLDRTLKIGGLSTEFMPSSRSEMGIAAHTSVTTNRPSSYEREISCHLQFEARGYKLLLNGRIDGIMCEDGQLVVEEIKSTFQPLSTIQPQQNLYYLAQLRLYHHYISQQNPSSSVQAMLTYVNPISLVERSFIMDWSAVSSETFFADLAGQFIEQLINRRNWQQQRDISIRALLFPFASLRQGQVELIGTVEKAIQSHRDLLLQAATGIGKTIGVLFPAVKLLAKKHGYSRIFFLTAKSAGVAAVRKAISTMREEGLHLRVLYLTAKDRVCPYPLEHRPDCDERYCVYAEEFYPRAARIMPDILKQEDMTSELIWQAANAHQLCPFELALELSLEADLIVCDYNYVFDPMVYLRRFFAADMPADNLLLIDEAHNLVPRSREMNSCWLDEELLHRLMAGHGCRDNELGYYLQRIIDLFAKWRQNSLEEGQEVLRLSEFSEDMIIWLEGVLELLRTILGQLKPGKWKRELLDDFFLLNRFATITDQINSQYAIYVSNKGSFSRLRLFCRHPGELLRSRLEKSCVAIFFSGTLSPAHYFRELLGIREGEMQLNLPCPFPRMQRLYLHVPNISTRFVKREMTRPTIARVLADVARSRPGNYLAFFPSYEYQGNAWAELMLQKPAGIKILAQKPSMSLAEQADFLQQVTSRDDNESHLGLAVMGGMFGEAIDMPGEDLVGVIIIGPGLPGIGLENELIREFFDEAREGEGYYYASVVPGMIRVIQAAGRVFRTPEDCGVVILIDERFLASPYRELLPDDWRVNDPDFSQENYLLALDDFWTSLEDELNDK